MPAMSDPSTSLRNTFGGVDQGALLQRLFTGAVPYAEWAGRVRHGAQLDVQRIDAVLRSADVGIMWPLGDMAREATALNPKAQGILGRRLIPYAAADWDLTAAEEGLSPKEREDAKRIADKIRAMVKGVRRFRQALLDLAFGFFDGRSALEAQYERRGSETWPTALEWLVPQRLSFDEGRRLIVVDRWGDYGLFRRRGPALGDVPGKFIQFTPRMFGDLQEREGLAPRYLFWLLFDRFGWRHRLNLTEAFGMPWMFVEQAVAEAMGSMKLLRDAGGEGGAPHDDGQALDYTLTEVEATKREGKWVGLPGQKAKLEWPPPEVHDFFSQGSDQILERIAFLTLHNSATSATGEDGANRANAVVLKAGEDGLFDLGGSFLSEALQHDWVNVLVELNFGPDALPLAPTFQLRTQPQRDRDKELERLKVVSAQVPVGVGVWYEVSGIRAPAEGEAIVQILNVTPTDIGATTRVDELRKKNGLDPVGGDVGQKWVIEHSAAFSAFGAAKGEAVGAAAAPLKSAVEPALPRDEGSSSAAEGALADLLEDADEDDQADAADIEAGGAVGMARAWFSAGRKVQPASVNGSPEIIVARGVKEATRHLSRWVDTFLDASDGTDAAKLYRRVTLAAKALDIEPLARAYERRILHSLMLGGLDSQHEATEEVTIAPTTFALLTFDGGVADFTTKPFGEAVKAFKARGVVSPREFDRLAAGAKKRAFTVAKLQSTHMVQTVHDELAKAIEEGTDLREFSKRLSARFDAAGWTQINPSHVETVFRTGVMSSYNDGRKAQMSTPVMLKMRPYWQILGVNDARTRPPHAAAIGKVLPATDPFFDRAGPPFGFNCRCHLTSKSAKDLQRLGLTPIIGAQLRNLPDPGWNADPIAPPGSYEEIAPAPPQRPATSPRPISSPAFDDIARKAKPTEVQAISVAKENVNPVFTARLGGVDVYMKPSHVHFDAELAVVRHRAVASAAEAMGAGDMVMPAALVDSKAALDEATKVMPALTDRKNGVTSLMFVTRSAPSGAVPAYAQDPKVLAKVKEGDRLTGAALDFLHANDDRHDGNVLVDGRGRLTLIDHDSTGGDGAAASVFFPGGGLGYSSRQRALADLPKALRAHVAEIAEADVAALAEKYDLEENAAAAMKARAQAVARSGLDGALAKHGAFWQPVGPDTAGRAERVVIQ